MQETNTSIVLSSIPEYTKLTDEETREYFKKIKSGDKEAFQEFFSLNLRLVAACLSNYSSKEYYDDLFQEGCMGLWRAIEKFDPDLGNQFSTYAYTWIKHKIQVGLCSQVGNIQIPRNEYVKYQRYLKQKQQLEETLGRVPTIEEMKEHLNFESKDIDIYETMPFTISMQAPISDEGECLFEEFIPSNEDLEEKVMMNQLEENIQDAIENAPQLTRDQKIVLIYRFGLGGKTPMTLQAIADEKGVSRERIRQIEKRALARLKENENFKELLDDYKEVFYER